MKHLKCCYKVGFHGRNKQGRKSNLQEDISDLAAADLVISVWLRFGGEGEGNYLCLNLKPTVWPLSAEHELSKARHSLECNKHMDGLRS